MTYQQKRWCRARLRATVMSDALRTANKAEREYMRHLLRRGHPMYFSTVEGRYVTYPF